MPIKNYVYGARPPVSGIERFRDEVYRMHKYRNDLVANDRARRHESEQLLRSHSPELERLIAEATEASESLGRVRDEVARQNRQASLDAAREAGLPAWRRAVPTIAADPKLARQADDLAEAASTAWGRVTALKKELYALKELRPQLDEIGKKYYEAGKDLQMASDLFWPNYNAVNEAASSFGKGAPPDKRHWHEVTRHRVCVQIQKETIPVGSDVWNALDKEVQDAALEAARAAAKDPNKAVKSVQLNGLSVEGLFAGTSTHLQAQVMPPPHGQADWGRRANRVSRRAARRKYIILRLRIGTRHGEVRCVRAGREVFTTRIEPVFVEVPVVMHRPLPRGCRIKQTFLFRDRVGVRDRWSVMFVVDIPDSGVRHPDAAAGGSCAVVFKSSRRPDGSMLVAEWAGDDGRTGELVLPAEDLRGGTKVFPAIEVLDKEGKPRLIPERQISHPGGRFEEGPTLRSELDGIRNLALDLLAAWMTGQDAVTVAQPFRPQSDQDPEETPSRRLTGFRGDLPAEFLRLFVGPDGDTPTPAQAASWVRGWRSDDRLDRLVARWASVRFPGDDAAYALMEEWQQRYFRLEDRMDHSMDQHRAWRTEFYRLFAVRLRRSYRRFYLSELGADQEIVKPARLKVEGAEYRPDPDNDRRRTASCGRLRQILTDLTEAPYSVPYCNDAADLLREYADNPEKATPLVVVRAKKVRRKKVEGDAPKPKIVRRKRERKPEPR